MYLSFCRIILSRFSVSPKRIAVRIFVLIWKSSLVFVLYHFKTKRRFTTIPSLAQQDWNHLAKSTRRKFPLFQYLNRILQLVQAAGKVFDCELSLNNLLKIKNQNFKSSSALQIKKDSSTYFTKVIETPRRKNLRKSEFWQHYQYIF
jgi:hypothetical protein